MARNRVWPITWDRPDENDFRLSMDVGTLSEYSSPVSPAAEFGLQVFSVPRTQHALGPRTEGLGRQRFVRACCHSAAASPSRGSASTLREPAPFVRCAEPTVAELRKPTQTGRSSRRQQQNQTWDIVIGVERLLEVPEISFRECDNRLLAWWRRAGTPHVNSRQQYKNRRHRYAHSRRHVPARS